MMTGPGPLDQRGPVWHPASQRLIGWSSPALNSRLWWIPVETGEIQRYYCAPSSRSGRLQCRSWGDLFSCLPMLPRLAITVTRHVGEPREAIEAIEAIDFLPFMSRRQYQLWKTEDGCVI